MPVNKQKQHYFNVELKMLLISQSWLLNTINGMSFIVPKVATLTQKLVFKMIIF